MSENRFHRRNAILAIAVFLFLVMSARPGLAQEQQVLTAAVPENFPPYYMLDSEGHITGYAIETMTVLADKAGVKVRYLVKPDWDSTMAALRLGEADLIPNLGITPERKKAFDFTSPLETFGLGMFVRSVSTDIHGMENLAGKQVAVVKLNAAVKWLENHPEVDRRLYDNQEQALFALLAGEVDAFIYPIMVTWKMAADIGVDDRIRQTGLPLLEIKRAVAVRRGNEALLSRLDQAVREYTGSESFAKTYVQWHAKPKLFWTLERVMQYSTIIVSLLLLFIAVILWWRRHHTISSLKRKLENKQNEVAHAKAEIATLKEQMRQAEDEREVSGATGTDSKTGK